MAKALDFNKIKKPFWTVTLADDDNTVLMVKTPTKATWEKIVNLHNSLQNAGEIVEAEKFLDDIFEACAEILSNNKTGKIITVDDLEACFDFADAMLLFNGYVEFIQEATNSKN